MGIIVAIDGPAGSGKGTVTETLAKKHKLYNIDTGAMYRCVALEVINQNIDLKDIESIKKLLKDIKIEIKEKKGKQKVFLNNKDVSEKIRSIEVTKIVSVVSVVKEVRDKLVEMQRKMAIGKDIIMEGRDITTVVFPNADIKIYLDAKLEIRAKRRYKQNIQKNIKTAYDEVLEDMRKRDENDMNKPYGALKIAKDAVVIDNTNMTTNQVIKQIGAIIKQVKKRKEIEEKIYRIRPETRSKKIKRKIIKAVLSGIYRVVYRVKIKGIENLPKEKGYIICGNHINTLDAAGIVLLNKQKIRFIGKYSLFKIGILRWLAGIFDIIPIKRGMQDIEAMKRSLRALKNNEILGIFPEGTRKGLIRQEKAKNGAAFMALRAGVPVVPVGIQGNFKPFTKVVFNYGKPIYFKDYNPQDKDDIERATDLIMDNIIMLTNDEK